MLKKSIMFFIKRPLLLLLVVVITLPLFTFIGIQSLHITSEPEFCETCHALDINEVGGEYFSWAHNIHYYAEVQCMDCHARPGLFHYLTTKALTGVRDVVSEIIMSDSVKANALREASVNPIVAAKIVPTENCLFCHSDGMNQEIRDDRIMKLFVTMRGVDNIENPEYREERGMADITVDDFIGANAAHSVHLDAGVNCVDCHQQEPHGGDLFNPVQMNTCFSCHNDIRNNTGTYSFLRQNIADLESIPDNEDCETCHTVQVKSLDGTLAEKFGIPQITGEWNGSTCTDCHDGAFGVNIITMGETTDARVAFEDRYDLLMDMWIAVYRNHMSLTYEQREDFVLLKNYVKMLTRDGSAGYHNEELYDTIFQRAFEIAHKLQSVPAVQANMTETW